VSKPFELIIVPDITAPIPAALELTFHVTAVSGLLVPVTEALNWKELPVFTDWFDGLTATPVTVGRRTVTWTVPDFAGSAAEVAIIYRVVTVSPAATVSTPLELMFVPGVTAPVPAAFELTFHRTVLSGL